MAARRTLGKSGTSRQAVIRLPDQSVKNAPAIRSASSSPSPSGHLAEAWQLARLLVVMLTAGEERREIAANRVIYVMSGKAKRRAPTLVTRATLLLAMLALPRVASAQTARVLTPTEMFDPENSPGVPLGDALVLRNETTLQAQGNSNIYNVDTGSRADTIGILQSDLHLATTSARHWAELSAGGMLQRYAKIGAEDTSTYHGSARTRLDLGHRITVNADGELARDYEMRGTAGDQFTTDHPVLYNRKQLHVRLARSGGILEVAFDGSLRTQDYLKAAIQGVPVDLSYRNATVRQGMLETQYRLSPALRLYTELSVNQVTYAQNLGYPRNSSGYAALAGVHVAVSSVIDAEAAVGYMRQTFQLASSPPVSGISYKLAGNWTPTPMWRLTATGRRDVDASPLTNSPAIVRSTFDLKGQRALGDRVLVDAHAAYTQEDYRGLPRSDRRVEAGAGGHYRLTRNVGLLAQAGWRQQWGGASGRSYSGFSGSVGVRVVL
ncbi:outer membrane beta-barrel protein [Novosphingobium terrae]|uniref:outer membrane beta-barrel protein n=1 Tax=Novosphingobium terrae TaxID=2726189 RepID=UPI001F1312E1|nr:outer membrane beta-barrel protein [Novosphingobium terrae]